MAEELEVGCTRPNPEVEIESKPEQIIESVKKEKRNMIMVGKKAPNFTIPAYHKGEFTQVKLADYLGKWVVLCFYPGDFTFV